jgi:putative sterol carrier protein
MTKNEMAAKLNDRQAWLPGKRIKFDFGDDGVVLIDGIAERVTEEDGAADTTIAISWDDLEALRRRELDPMSALMQGRIRIDGDMANAMQLAGLTAKLQG